ncbi:hypothetical protein DL95DRAFT_459090 [Leptodontidium sp. 2 PMI_412]|nr:hypothetical protein BKA61DRAFT_574504 [Leptodontidium sp. MPI-SDFR-AT-0119]KAH9217483.1 hypothetical protein DL95DRAFT_459090 [Leptodontidium sp. 2 PMI_412]
MRFNKSALVSLFTLASIASSQVIVTVTSTVTIVTITITPTTSTSTAYVTVTGKPPQSTSTSYYTVTVTASQSLPTQLGNCPIEEWGQCGGDGYVGKCAGSCGNNSVCKYKDVWYSYCSKLPAMAVAVVTVYQS